MKKVDVTNSPLLKKVVERDYTKGFYEQKQPQNNGAAPDGGGAAPAPDDPGGGPAPGAPGPKFNLPPPAGGPSMEDTTKEFQFDDIDPNQIDGSEHPGPISIDSGTAKSFANTVGNLLQVYMPQVGFMIAKVDMESIQVNIAKGVLTENWYNVFENINENTEEALKPDDAGIKAWKIAFKDWLEYQKIEAANPNTAFALASAALIGTFAWKVKECARKNEDAVRRAIEHCSPYMFKKAEEPEKPKKDEPEKK